MTDVKKLRELAEKATPGPWDPIFGGGGHYQTRVAETDTGFVHARVNVDTRDTEHDTRFIAASNPQAIIEVLDRLERYEKALRDVGTYHSHDSLIQSVFETAREALEGGKP